MWHTMVDISASTRASYEASTTSDSNFISLESNKEIHDALLKPLCESNDSSDDDNDDLDKDPQPGLRN